MASQQLRVDVAGRCPRLVLHPGMLQDVEPSGHQTDVLGFVIDCRSRRSSAVTTELDVLRMSSEFSEEMAEREGFEPPCRLPDKTLSRRPRYDHFGTSPGR